MKKVALILVFIAVIVALTGCDSTPPTLLCEPVDKTYTCREVN